MHSNIVHKSQKVNTTDGWMDGWMDGWKEGRMDKQKMANSWDEISSSRKRMKH